jgi:1-aminocyclopropane-1-carboxylate deaminase/D-cysteine desulfhydrase-like pyridoxal-dependent ACC family enzyme
LSGDCVFPFSRGNKSSVDDHVLQACGSGATTGGLAIANHLSGYGAKVIGYGVCDSEEYFYDFIDGLFKGLGSDVKARDALSIHNAKGAGYAVSRWDRPPSCSLLPASCW